MTVDKIKVKSFQSIKQGEVDLGSFTVFTGPSSSGKSAFLRAAEALVRNSFVPSQVRMGDNLSEVTMEVDGHTVTAQRGKSKSTYILDGEEFTKAGRSVPEEIAEVFSLPQILEVESTFATQFDKPYLIADPGSVAAKVLGSLTNVSVLHSGLRETNRRALELRSLLKVKKADRDTMVESLKEFDGLDAQLTQLKDAEAIMEEAESHQERISEVEKSIGVFESHRQELLSIKENMVDLDRPEDLLENILKMEPRLVALNNLVHALEGASERLPSWDYTQVPTEIPDASEDENKMKRHDSLIQDITAKAVELKNYLTSSETIAATIADLQAQYDTILNGLDVCPLCNSQIGE